MKYSTGIMQGRLTEPRGRGIQFFPFENWEREFDLAGECGLDEIEFIFDYEDFEKNPLWSDEGVRKIRERINASKVQVHAVCFDYFMRRPFYKFQGEEEKAVREENTMVMKRVLDAMDKLGAGLLEIPLVDGSSLSSEAEKEIFREWLKERMEHAPGGIRFGLETDLAPREFKAYLLSFGEAGPGANYDSGNSSGLGYDPYEETTVLRDRILNIHIKDRLFHGTTVKLGTGSADFERLFKGLKEIGYSGSFILQAARGRDGSEKETVAGQAAFLKEWTARL